MEVPGLNSLFISTKIMLKSNIVLKKKFYKIINVEKRIGLVNLKFFGRTIESDIQTIVRQKPVKNPSFKMVKNLSMIKSLKI